MNYYYASLLSENLVEDTYLLEDECEYTDEEWSEVFDGYDD